MGNREKEEIKKILNKKIGNYKVSFVFFTFGVFQKYLFNQFFV